VRRADLAADETAVVLGGGPIGVLVALVARETGARVLISEVNPLRLDFARSLGLDAVTPADVGPRVRELTEDAGADVVFEVSGAAPAVEQMTELAALRGRIVVVAIHGEARPVRLFDFFWKELDLRGARVYEPEDYDRAISLLAGGRLPLERLITRVEPLDRLPALFHELGDSVKVLVDCRR
jgi:threonine dehydrogenase-like Zn-dependent dehydrogenase